MHRPKTILEKIAKIYRTTPRLIIARNGYYDNFWGFRPRLIAIYILSTQTNLSTEKLVELLENCKGYTFMDAVEYVEIIRKSDPVFDDVLTSLEHHGND